MVKFEENSVHDNAMEKRKKKNVGLSVAKKVGVEKSGEGKKKRKRVSSSVDTANVNTTPLPILEGMSAAEVKMIRKLAGNDGDVRKRTMRKMKKWLSVLVLKFPVDSSEMRLEIEANIARVWKALFYCMWMADKPLPQEQLAEQISKLVHIFGMKSNVFLVFVEWFYRTMGREWSWIDRYRLDKFMMLCRRFLRATLLTMSSRNWNDEMVKGFLDIIRIRVFNHYLPTDALRNVSNEVAVSCPIGLQIHLIDIFLEELAKSRADGSTAINFLDPFIEELAQTKDKRLQNCITERIFHHLMKQSDVGIDYQESLMGAESADDEDDDYEDEESCIGVDDASEEISQEESEMYEALNGLAGPMDPRAGAVDVVLPQIELDYTMLAEKLIQAGGLKSVKKRNRGKLYSLAENFKDLAEGKYPLALPKDEPWRPAIPSKEINKAAKRLLELEQGETKQTVKSLKANKIKKDSPPTADESLQIPSPLEKCTKLVAKKRKNTNTPLSEGAKRRINFVLTKNLEHDATDYMPSISKSPAIPFDANKTPTSGILKAKTTTSTRTSSTLTPNRKKSSQRKVALNFFMD